MIAFQVQDMTCGHCASTITKALKSVDPGAKVMIDLAKHLVKVEPINVSQQELNDTIVEAGYSPVLDESATLEPGTRNGTCCGHCR
jgi:copper chaperone